MQHDFICFMTFLVISRTSSFQDGQSALTVPPSSHAVIHTVYFVVFVCKL